MTDAEQIPAIGGPKNGEVLPFTSGGIWIFPDGQDSVSFVTSDGHACTLFGEHRYDLRAYAKRTEQGGLQVVHQWEYVGYTPPPQAPLPPPPAGR